MLSTMLKDDRIGSAFVVGGIILLYVVYRVLCYVTKNRWR